MEKTNAKAEAYKEMANKMFWVRHDLVEIWNEAFDLEEDGNHELSDQLFALVTKATSRYDMLEKKTKELSK